MNILARSCLRVVLVAALFACFPEARAATEATPADESAGQQVTVIDVPAGLSLAHVQSAIVRPAVRLKWQIQQKTDGRIVCHYERGKNEATLTLTYDTKQIVIFAVGHSRGGGLPMRWIDRLRGDIVIALGEELGLSK